MTIRNVLCISLSLLLFALISKAEAKLTKEQIYSLFNQANEAFRQANSIKADAESANKLYENSILNYEKIISEGKISNPKLYYNLGNTYFLKGDLGRAILNYRRADKLDSGDRNIQKNLDFARSKTIDRFQVKSQEKVLQTLFFWHYDFPLKTKFVLACLSFATLCSALAVMIWFGRTAPVTATAVTGGILLVCFITSVVLEANDRASRICGVITAQEVIARQGDGESYSASFKDPLHAGTEFDLLEHRYGWLHIKLPDNSEGWIPKTTADLI